MRKEHLKVWAGYAIIFHRQNKGQPEEDGKQILKKRLRTKGKGRWEQEAERWTNVIWGRHRKCRKWSGKGHKNDYVKTASKNKQRWQRTHQEKR